MTDPIRAALEAAARTLCVTAGNEPDQIDHFQRPPRPWWTRYEGTAAVSVAAFLRALPACDVMMERNSWEGGPHSTQTLAAAVERAANMTPRSG